MRLTSFLSQAILLSACSRAGTRADGPRPSAIQPTDGVIKRFWKTEKTPSRVKQSNSL
jgi:hypothetical protein